jgi:hypothetical protein
MNTNTNDFLGKLKDCKAFDEAWQRSIAEALSIPSVKDGIDSGTISREEAGRCGVAALLLTTWVFTQVSKEATIPGTDMQERVAMRLAELMAENNTLARMALGKHDH